MLILEIEYGNCYSNQEWRESIINLSQHVIVRPIQEPGIGINRGRFGCKIQDRNDTSANPNQKEG
jgi:hypothetical protein